MIEMPKVTLSDEQKIAVNVLSLNTAINDIQSDVKKLNEIVISGENPLREIVRSDHNYIAEIKGWVKFIVSLLIAQFLAFTVASIVAYIKFLPLIEDLARQAK